MSQYVFVTGIFGTGKTSFCEQFIKDMPIYKFINFDSIFDYSTCNDRAILDEMQKHDFCIIDAIPFGHEPVGCLNEFTIFHTLYHSSIIVMVCEPNLWLERIKTKAWYDNTKVNEYLRQYIEFYSKINQSPYRIYDTGLNEYINDDRMRVYALDALYKYKTKQDYDKNYQDIEILTITGYSESHKTWDTIKDLVNWNNKTVCDLGCFHGYFSIKAAKYGVKVTGLDRSNDVLKTTRMISVLSNINASFNYWDGDTDDIPECDIILCLNMMHHVKNQDAMLSRMKCKQAIFEINVDQVPLVEKYFTINKELLSYREQRTILLCDKKETV